MPTRSGKCTYQSSILFILSSQINHKQYVDSDDDADSHNSHVVIANVLESFKDFTNINWIRCNKEVTCEGGQMVTLAYCLKDVAKLANLIK